MEETEEGKRGRGSRRGLERRGRQRGREVSRGETLEAGRTAELRCGEEGRQEEEE